MTDVNYRTARALERVSVSPLFGLLAEAAKAKAAGRHVISLSAGEPDFDTPSHIVEAGILAMSSGNTRYTPVSGTSALKAAIRHKLLRDNELEYSDAEIIATTGAKQALYNFCVAMLDPGDEVIIPAPYWPSYVDMVRLTGAREVIAPTLPDEGFRLSAQALRGALTRNTRAVFLNSPGNPSGACYSAKHLRALARVLEDFPEVLVVSDEIYEHLRYGGGAYMGLLNAVPGLRARTVVINGVSKAYAMTGWRLGFAAGPKQIISAMEAVQSHSTSNPCSISQAAAIVALTGDQSPVQDMVRVFGRRHDELVSAVNAIPGLSCRPADGAFYLMIDVRAWIELKQKELASAAFDDVALSRWLLSEHDLALAAGSWFGMPGFLRASFAASDESLRDAVQRLATAARKWPEALSGAA